MKQTWLLAVLLLGSASALLAQDDRRADTRQDLEARRDSLAEVLTVLEPGDERTAVTERRLATIEQRLRIGDFRPGDMVSLEVRGRAEYTGNFPVQPDQTLELPGVDRIAMNGVLYSEAPAVIREALARVLRNPVVELTYQMRLAVTGQVGEPGFRDVPGSILLSDVITLAGGPTQNADLDGIEVRRDGKAIMSGERLVTQGLTLDDLGLRSGDVVNVPRDRDTFHTVRTIGILLGAVGSAIALISLLF